MRRTGQLLIVTALAVLVQAALLSAQNWSFDARDIALGGIGNGGNLAADMIQEERSSRAIVLPFGLLQVVPNLHVFDPSSDRFDPARAGEYAASPIHYIVGRDHSSTGQLFVDDIRNARLSRDLNTYRGFVPAARLQEAGLAASSWGGTIKLSRGNAGSFQGIFIGGGPYFATQTTTTVDERLRTLLASETPVVAPNTSFAIDNATANQMAVSIIGGYRARFALAGTSSERSGLYVAANYRYLRGFLYEDFGLCLRLDTDRAGLLTVNPTTVPLEITRLRASRGRGAAIDVGVGAVLDRIEFGFGANGLANRIDWNDVERHRYTIQSLVTGGEFLESLPTPIGDVRVELPVDYRGHFAYRADAWLGALEVGRGIQGNTLRGGAEWRLGYFALRGGMRYVRQRWEPRGGIGVNLSPRVGIDVTAFSTSANLQRKRQLAIATSLRLTAR